MEARLLSEVIRESVAGDAAPRLISSREGGMRVSVAEEAAIAELEQAAELALSTAMQAAADAQNEAEKRVAAAEERAESHALALKRAAVVARVEAARRAQQEHEA